MERHEIPLVYLDEDILVINKPSGLLSVADGYDPELPTVSSLLAAEYGNLWMVHRLDRETSGLLLLARNAESHRELNRQFRERMVRKSYWALVSPKPEWGNYCCEEALAVNQGRAHLTKVDPVRGKAAETCFEVLASAPIAAILNCKPRTGYRHQIRAHLYHLGLGILGDTLYKPKGVPLSEQSFDRLMLQASQLECQHPKTGKELRFDRELDPALRVAWEGLVALAASN